MKHSGKGTKVFSNHNVSEGEIGERAVQAGNKLEEMYGKEIKKLGTQLGKLKSLTPKNY